MTAAESADLAQRYDPRDVQEKWQARWVDLDPFWAGEDPADDRERFYLVDMFPYPSGDLHMGHAKAYAIGDALARYHFLRARNVLTRSAGTPSACQRRTRPSGTTPIRPTGPTPTSRPRPRRSAAMRRPLTGAAGCRPATPPTTGGTSGCSCASQRGLAYRRGGYVNWCPVDQTVLANEQVIAGKCERCEADVVRRMLTQWYFKITEYADRPLR